MLRLLRDDFTLGTHMHRSGWPYVVNGLAPILDDRAVLVLDDFVEKTFFNKRPEHQGFVHREPWVGICHHPPDIPRWYITEHPLDLSQMSSWLESLSNMRLCVTLADQVASWMRETWRIPSVALKHPTEVPAIRWEPSRFLSNRRRMLLQVGWYLRNTHAIFEVDAPRFLSKACLRQASEQIAENHRLAAQILAPKRKTVGETLEIPAVNNIEYDQLLSENIVFVELIAAAANNTVVECIARNTPIVVNRLSGPEYYLGRDYPLFYDVLDDVADLLTVDRIIEAYTYLVSMDKRWLDVSTFRTDLADACLLHAPEFLLNRGD